MLPLYGFLQGDVLGLVILAEEHETVQQLAEKLRQAARVRVPTRGAARLWYKGQRRAPDQSLSQIGIEPLERFDVVQEDHG